MNYSSQLLGWAIDRVTEAHKAGIVVVHGVEELAEEAKNLAEICYVPDSDFNNCIQRITQILKESPDALDKVNQLQNELAFIEEELNRQAEMRNAGQDNQPMVN